MLVTGSKSFFFLQVDAQIYLWRWDTRIVISDVDGTITKYGGSLLLLLANLLLLIYILNRLII